MYVREGIMGKRNRLRSMGKFLGSMKFGMLLLAILAMYSLGGTVVPQGQALSFYEGRYNAFPFALIKHFQLHRAYTSIYFMVLTLALSMNLLVCTVRRLPRAMKSYQRASDFDLYDKQKPVVEEEWTAEEEPEKLLKSIGFKKIKILEKEKDTIYFSSRRGLGHFGSFLVHLGLLLIIVAYTTGKIFGYETFVRGIPGDELALVDTPYHVHIEDFDILYRPDYSVHQYISTLSMTNEEGQEVARGETSVNHPLSHKGHRVYQSGTGWMMDLVVREKGEEIRRERFYQSGYVYLEEQDVAIEFRHFYPDFVMVDGEAYTKTPFLNRPRYFYVIYEEGFSVHMNVAGPGQIIGYKDLEFQAFQPQLYTVLQVVKDPGAFYAGVGGMLMLLGLVGVFYYTPQYAYIKVEEGRKTLFAGTMKNKESFSMDLQGRLASLKKERTEEDG